MLCIWLLPSTFCKFKPEPEAFFESATERLPDGDARLRLEIHPEVERPATLNRSKPSTAGATKSNPAFRISTVSQSLDEEHNLHVWEKVHLMESSFLRILMIVNADSDEA